VSDTKNRIRVGDIIRYDGQDNIIVVGYVYECSGDSCKLCIFSPVSHRILYYGANGPARSSIEVLGHCDNFTSTVFPDLQS